MSKCTRGLHEMTEDNTRLNKHGRKECRECLRERRSGYRKARSAGGTRDDATFNKDRTEMDEALAKRPPEILWRKDKHGILRAAEVRDPHAETTTAAQARRLRAAAEIAEREEAARQAEITRLQVLQLMQDQAAEVVEHFRKHRADNTPLMSAARRSI